jgi:hypothetical protein
MKEDLQIRERRLTMPATLSSDDFLKFFTSFSDATSGKGGTHANATLNHLILSHGVTLPDSLQEKLQPLLDRPLGDYSAASDNACSGCAGCTVCILCEELNVGAGLASIVGLIGL